MRVSSRLSVMVFILLGTTRHARAAPQNILFIMADDLGWRDLGCYGSTWPGVTKGGTVNDNLIQSIDWMPTLLEMVDVSLPSNAKPDGISIAPAIKGGALNRDTIFTHFPHDTPASGQHPGSSVRRGDWKLIRLFAGNEDGSDKLELYNLRADLGETRDLAAEKPELARELNALISGFLKDADAVIPKLNPEF